MNKVKSFFEKHGELISNATIFYAIPHTLIISCAFVYYGIFANDSIAWRTFTTSTGVLYIIAFFAFVIFARSRKIETPVEQPKNNGGLPDGLEWPEDVKWKWFAVDGNLDAYFHEDEPIRDDEYWFSNKGDLHIGFLPNFSTDWKNSLVKRPD